MATQVAAQKLKARMRLVHDRRAGALGDSCIVQPQPTVSVVSMAPGAPQLCVCEVILDEDSGDCGNGEAARFFPVKPHHQPFSLRKRLTVRRDTMPVVSATNRAMRITIA